MQRANSIDARCGCTHERGRGGAVMRGSWGPNRGFQRGEQREREGGGKTWGEQRGREGGRTEAGQDTEGGHEMG